MGGGGGFDGTERRVDLGSKSLLNRYSGNTKSKERKVSEELWDGRPEQGDKVLFPWYKTGNIIIVNWETEVLLCKRSKEEGRDLSERVRGTI